MIKGRKKPRSARALERDVQRAVLDNGVRVLTEKAGKADAVAVGVYVDAGSRYEELKESGATHILQRIALRGTRNRSEAQIAKQLDSLGGDVEYQTGRDFACWFANVKAGDLGKALDLLGDLTLHPQVTRTAITAEQEILLGELLEDESDPDFNLERMFLRSLWKTSGLCRPPRGRVLVVKDKPRLDELKPKSIERFHRETHHPEALTIVLSGSLDHGKALAAAEKVFGGLEMPKKTVGTATPSPFRFVALRTRAEFPGVRMQLGVPACGASDDRRHAAQLLNAILGGSDESRLAQLVRKKSFPVEEGDSTLDMFSDAGLLSIRIRTAPKDAEQALETAVAELRKLTTSDADDAELEQAQTDVEAVFLAATETLKTRVEGLARNERYFGEVVDAASEFEKIEAVSPEDLRHLATEWIAPHNLSLAALGDLKGADIKPDALRW